MIVTVEAEADGSAAKMVLADVQRGTANGITPPPMFAAAGIVISTEPAVPSRISTVTLVALELLTTMVVAQNLTPEPCAATTEVDDPSVMPTTLETRSASNA